jgi:hypothetical protein
MNIYCLIIGSLLIISAYILLFRELLKNHDGISAISFILWAILDTIAALTTISHGGLWWIVLSLFAGGSTSVAIYLYKKGERTWTKLDKYTVIATILCIVVWLSAGKTAGTIAASIGIVIAGFSQIKESWLEPQPNVLASWFLFAIGSTFLGFVSDATEIEDFIAERLSSFTNAGLSTLIFFLTFFRLQKTRG